MLASQLAISGYHLLNPSFTFPHFCTARGCLLKPDKQDKPQGGKEIRKTKTNNTWDVTFIQQQNTNTVLVVKKVERKKKDFRLGRDGRARGQIYFLLWLHQEGERQKRNKGRSYESTRVQTFVHQHLEETCPQLLLHDSRLSPIITTNTLLPRN